MAYETMTNEERANTDKLDFYFQEKIKVHIILKRTNKEGRNIFLNGLILEKLTPRVWMLRERILGDVRIAISEIREDGVKEMEVRV